MLTANMGTAGHIPKHGNRSSRSSVNSRDTKPSFAEGRPHPTSNVPPAQFRPVGSVPKSTSSHHTLPCQSDKGQAQALETGLSCSPNLVAPFTNPHLTCDCGTVETRSTASSSANTIEPSEVSGSTSHSYLIDVCSYDRGSGGAIGSWW